MPPADSHEFAHADWRWAGPEENGIVQREKIIIVIAGTVVGIASLVLAQIGNPANMGFCTACFERDIAGALGLHDFSTTAWMRPEIAGIVIGAFLTALFTGEFRPEGGSSPAVRFLLAMFVMIGALTFLGCPLRMILRLGGGDLNAVVGLVGFTVGIAAGVILLRQGFNLGKTKRQRKTDGLIMPAVMVGLLLLAILLPAFKDNGPIIVGTKGHPGCAGTPVGREIGLAVSLGFGLIVGVLAQRSRLCLAGGIRDAILIRSGLLLSGFIAILAVCLAGNAVLGNFHPGFENQPVAHTAHLWNFLGMAVVGLGSVLLGGCPFRQLVLAGNGNTDSSLTIFGMIAGAAAAHNFGLVKAASPFGKGAVLAGLIVLLVIGFANRER